jgi:LCP family protein required for cell wall assembly
MDHTSNKPQTEQTKPQSIPWLRIALWGGFIIAALLTAYLTFSVVRDLVATWQITNLPGVTVKDPTATPAPGETPVADPSSELQPVSGPTPPPWDGADRVSVLVMGLDYRDWASGEGPPRTDTMILFTIDPINRTAGILSIPRDLWVNIPGFEYARINSAFQLGEAYEIPGGGPQLAADTVEELLGVPVDYYAQVDFGAFVRFIDEIGGVEVDVPETIKIDPLGDNNTKKLKPGRYNLPGDLALAYVRARKTEGGDFDRAQRQQQVILSIRDRILEYELLPILVGKAPTLYNELSSGIRTNLNLDQAIKLAWLAIQVPEGNIKQGAIGSDHITFAKSPDGTQDVLKPLTEKIRELRDEIFTETGPASPVAISMDPAELVKTEGARVSVLNGSYTAGLAARTTEYLQAQGINVVQTANSDQYATYTEITFYNGKPYTTQFLVDLMQISPFRIRHFFDPASQADIVIILGDDWAANNPMP